MLKRENLHNYQNKAVELIKNKIRCALFLDMGMGKTATTLTAYSDLIDDFMVNRVLIIAPLRVANTVWAQEARQWEHLNHLSFSICTGTTAQREAAVERDVDVYVINRENIPWLVENYGTRWKWDSVVIDESSSFKSHASKRFKALKKMMPKTHYITLLTGTPSPNGLKDLWSQLFLIDYGERLGRTWTAFKTRFFKPSGFMGYQMEINDGADEIIMRLVEDVCLSMKAEDYLELPDRIDLFEKVDLPRSTRKIYEKLEKDFTFALGDTHIDAMSAAALGNKLLQVCNGSVYDEQGEALKLHNEKVEALKEIVEQNPDENMLVAYNFKFDLETLKAAFPDAVVLDTKPETIDRWNAGKIKMLLCHPASAGHGLNIQRGGSMVVWFGLNWSLELYQQFNARLHRQGQTDIVRVVHLVADGCIDEKVVGAIRSKAKTQDELLNYLKESLT